MRESILLLVFLATARAQSPPVPYEPNSDGPGPTFSISNDVDNFPGTYTSIRNVNFRKLPNPFALSGEGSSVLAAVKKFFARKDPDFHSSQKLETIHYLNGSPSSSGGSALLIYSWFAVGGSSSQGGVVKVFIVHDGHLQSTQAINWDTHFDAGQPTESFDPRTNNLIIRSAHYIPGDAHCCVSAMDVVTFRWDGKSFVETGFQTELSEYGKSQGKVLPQ